MTIAERFVVEPQKIARPGGKWRTKLSVRDNETGLKVRLSTGFYTCRSLKEAGAEIERLKKLKNP